MCVCVCHTQFRGCGSGFPAEELGWGWGGSRACGEQRRRRAPAAGGGGEERAASLVGGGEGAAESRR